MLMKFFLELSPNEKLEIENTSGFTTFRLSKTIDESDTKCVTHTKVYIVPRREPETDVYFESNTVTVLSRVLTYLRSI